MAQMKVFVSHSHTNNAFCADLVGALKGAGADVWYDDESLHSGQLGPIIERELRERPVFIVVLSPAALASQWVEDETRWAYNRLRRDPSRIILPVIAEPLGDEDAIWLFLQDFKRVGASGTMPFPQPQAVTHTLYALQLTPLGEAPRPTAPQPNESAADLLTRGKALGLQEKEAEALPLFQRATQLDPNSSEAWARLSLALSIVGQPVEGLLASEHTLSLDPGFVLGWFAKAAGLYVLGYYEEALAACDRALALDLTSERAWNGRGNALGGLKRYEEALVSFDRALALDPNYAGAWNNKGDALNKLERYQEAFDASERASALEGETAARWDTKGEALLGLGRFEQALLSLTRSLSLDADSPAAAETWGKKATALRALGRIAEAEEAERRAKALSG